MFQGPLLEKSEWQDIWHNIWQSQILMNVFQTERKYFEEEESSLFGISG